MKNDVVMINTITEDYLKYYRVFRDSIRKFHPEIRFILYAIDLKDIDSIKADDTEIVISPIPKDYQSYIHRINSPIRSDVATFVTCVRFLHILDSIEKMSRDTICISIDVDSILQKSLELYKLENHDMCLILRDVKDRSTRVCAGAMFLYVNPKTIEFFNYYRKLFYDVINSGSKFSWFDDQIFLYDSYIAIQPKVYRLDILDYGIDYTGVLYQARGHKKFSSEYTDRLKYI